MAAGPKLTVVITAFNEAPYLRDTVSSFQATLPEGSEIVVVDDGSTDGGADFLVAPASPARLIRCPANLGLTKARNLGVQHAQNEVVVIADAHMCLPPDWWIPMVELLENPAVGAVAPAIARLGDYGPVGYGLHFASADLTAEWLDRSGDQPYPAPLLPGACLAIRGETYRAVGGFDEGMPLQGTTDAELCLRLWLFGYELWLTPSVVVAHKFTDEDASETECGLLIHNRLRTAFVHFDRPRIARVVEALEEYEGFEEGVALAAVNGTGARRAEMISRRKREAAWFFERFGSSW